MFADCEIFFAHFKKFTKNKKKTLKHKFLNFLILHKPFLGSREVPPKVWARSVQPF